MYLNNFQQHNRWISKDTEFENHRCVPMVQYLNFPQVFCDREPPTTPSKSCNVQGFNKNIQTFDLFPISFCKKLCKFSTKETQTHNGEESLANIMAPKEDTTTKETTNL